MEKAATIQGSTKAQEQSVLEKKSNKGMENVELVTIWRPWETKIDVADDIITEDKASSPVKTNPSPPKKLSCQRRLIF